MMGRGLSRYLSWIADWAMRSLAPQLRRAPVYEEPGTFRTGDFGYLRGAVFLEPFPLYLVGGFVSQR